MQVHVLASGSDGNSTVVTEGNTAILIDAGLGPRQLKTRLAPLGIALADVEACFLTHEHTDHISGMRRHSYPKVQLIGNLPTLTEVCEVPFIGTRYPCCEQRIGATITVGSLSVTSFSVSHDSAASVGYIVRSPSAQLVYATDLGVASSELHAALTEADYVVLEANHDMDMLRTGPYPYNLKRRVAGRKGHLANDQTAALLVSCLSERTKWLALAHLSRTNNTPKIALQTIEQSLIGRLGLHPDLRVQAAPSAISGLPPVSS